MIVYEIFIFKINRMFQSRWATHITDSETIRDVTIPSVTTAQVRNTNTHLLKNDKNVK